MLNIQLPRIKSVSVSGPSILEVRWQNATRVDAVDLAGWIATGGDILSELSDPKVFNAASVANYGAAVAWDADDLAIDAAHLKLIADEQRPFLGSDAAKWQQGVGLSNNEVADLLGIGLSTWNDYKARKDLQLPAAVAMICRAVLRDPLLMQAHLRPRKHGRPKQSVSTRSGGRGTASESKRSRILKRAVAKTAPRSRQSKR